jgi:hypothetical protein
VAREFDVGALDLRPLARGRCARTGWHRLGPDPSVVGAMRSAALAARRRGAGAIDHIDALGPPGRLKHRSDRSTHEELRAAGLSERAIDTLLRPILSGVFGGTCSARPAVSST